MAAESQGPTPAALAGEPQAIVVLGGDVSHGVDGKPDDVGPLTLDRLRLAASVYRSRPLPVLVTGGSASSTGATLATFMADALRRDYGINATWIEDKSENTLQNALFSAVILRQNGISRVILVTQSWHMPRALWAFSQTGIGTQPAPAHRTYIGRQRNLTDFLPNYSSFEKSFYALHELLGTAYYQFRYSQTKRMR